MNCKDAEVYVSAMHDNEPVPADFLTHFEHCPACHERLRFYTQIGSECRELSARTTAINSVPELPPAYFQRGKASAVWRYLKGDTPVPRLAMLLLASTLLVLSVGLAAVHAQSPAMPLWFQFELTPEPSSADVSSRLNRQEVAQNGYDQTSQYLDGTGNYAIHVAVFSVGPGKVDVGIRIRRITTEEAPKINVRNVLMDLANHRYQYNPDRKLVIPVEGGGEFQLRGSIADHQPELAFGYPLKPQLSEFVLISPILVSGEKVLVNLAGSSARNAVYSDQTLVRLYSPEAGLFIFSLNPLPGFLEGTAEWGKLDFTIDHHSYSLFSAAPITGGDQPRTIWVKRVDHFPPLDHPFLGIANSTTP